MANEYDARITMDPGYRPPVKFRRPKRSLRLKRRALGLVAVAVAVLAALVGLEWGGGRDPRLPAIERLRDYKPALRLRLYARTGEVIAEHGTRRTRLAAVPERLASAVIARMEPGFLARPALGQLDLAKAVLAYARHRPPSSITVALAHSLTRALPDRGLVRYVKEWIVALRLERHLTREEILRLFLDEVPFGPGSFGAEEGARATFGVGASALDDAQAKELAGLAGEEEGPVWKTPPPPHAPGCGAEALRVLAARMPAEDLDRYEGKIVTPCEPALTLTAETAMKKQHLERADLVAAAVVMRLPGNEVAAVVGAHEPARPLGVLRAPLVIGAALGGKKLTAASALVHHGSTSTLRALAQRSPTSAADAILVAGAAKLATLELATASGVDGKRVIDGVAEGNAAVTPLEVASVLAAFAANGLHRVPQLLVSVGGEREGEGARAQVQALDGAAAYIATSLLQLPAPLPQKIARPVAGVVGGDARGAWFGGYGPGLVVVVWVGPKDGASAKAADVERAASAIGAELFIAASRGRPARPFERPSALLVRRIDGAGNILPRNVAAGAEEWFVSGSLPREEYVLPPEEPLRPPRDPEPSEEGDR